jgi:hypothetical protein
MEPWNTTSPTNASRIGDVKQHMARRVTGHVTHAYVASPISRLTAVLELVVGRRRLRYACRTAAPAARHCRRGTVVRMQVDGRARRPPGGDTLDVVEVRVRQQDGTHRQLLLSQQLLHLLHIVAGIDADGSRGCHSARRCSRSRRSPAQRRCEYAESWGQSRRPPPPANLPGRLRQPASSASASRWIRRSRSRCGRGPRSRGAPPPARRPPAAGQVEHPAQRCLRADADVLRQHDLVLLVVEDHASFASVFTFMLPQIAARESGTIVLSG